MDKSIKADRSRELSHGGAIGLAMLNCNVAPVLQRLMCRFGSPVTNSDLNSKV